MTHHYHYDSSLYSVERCKNRREAQCLGKETRQGADKGEAERKCRRVQVCAWVQACMCMRIGAMTCMQTKACRSLLSPRGPPPQQNTPGTGKRKCRTAAAAAQRRALASNALPLRSSQVNVRPTNVNIPATFLQSIAGELCTRTHAGTQAGRHVSIAL